MLDKNSDGDQHSHSGHCSDCGCSLSPLQDLDSTTTIPAPNQQQFTTDTPSKCPSCQARGTPSNGQRPHNEVHLEPHSCSVCNKTFISSAHLTLHLSSHNKERKFGCSICGKYFHQSSHLIAHQTTHSGDRPFKCLDCGKTFTRASHLNTHRRLHTGEKPFKCNFCNKSFTQKAGLLSHIRIHAAEPSPRCERCGQDFQSLSHLLSHKAEDACGNSKLTQDNPDDLKCGVCCRTFVRSSYIRLHIRLRKGQRPYHCKVCNKTFVKLETFVNHCDNHLKQKRDKNKQCKGKVVKPALFVPLSRTPSPTESLSPQTLELNTRSKSKTKTKTEHC